MPSYALIKALHLISMVAWFAGLFYIFRLFVYHRIHSENPPVRDLLSLMEGKLLRIIIAPASLATAAFGAYLIALNPALLQQGWLRLKLAVVGILFAYQLFARLTWKRFSAGDFFLTERQCRFVNELPTLILIAAVMLAVLKPPL